jgi:hypothetical protein
MQSSSFCFPVAQKQPGRQLRADKKFHFRRLPREFDIVQVIYWVFFFGQFLAEV